MESKEDHQRTRGNAPHLNISFCVRLWREFSWLPQIEILLTGYHSPSFLTVMQRRLISRLYAFVLSLVRKRGVAQWWKQSSPINVVCVHIPQLTPELTPLVGQVCCWSSSLLLVIFPQVQPNYLLKSCHFKCLLPFQSETHPTLAKRS